MRPAVRCAPTPHERRAKAAELWTRDATPRANPRPRAEGSRSERFASAARGVVPELQKPDAERGAPTSLRRISTADPETPDHSEPCAATTLPIPKPQPRSRSPAVA